MEKRRGVDTRGVVALAGVVALVVISLTNWRTVQRIDRVLGERLSKLTARLDPVATRMERAPAFQRGPDPNRVYTIKADGSPFRGKAGAPVTIAEFSDFQ